MGVSTTTNRISYTGTGSSYSFPYYFFNQSDLKVYLYNSSAGTVALQTLNTHYTIGGTPNQNGIYSSGGSIITTCSIINTLQVVIYRDPSAVQNFALLQSGLLPSTALVQQLDYITLLEQRLADQNSRSVSLSDGINQTFDPTLPVAMTASSALIINGAGSGFAIGPQADQIASAQSSAIAAAASAVTAASAASNAQSSNVSAGNNAVLAASAAVSAGNSVGLVGSTAYWATQAQSSAVSAGNLVVLANSAAVSAGAQAVLAGSSALSASNNAVLAGSAAVSAGNQTVLATSAAVSAGNLVGSISFPITVNNGGTGLTSFQAGAFLYGAGSSVVTSVKSAVTDGAILWEVPGSSPAFVSPTFYQNNFVNSAFDWWQVAVGSSVVVANSTAVYVPDQWYITNLLGTNGVITVQRASSAINGSLFACKVQITTEPTAAQINGTELWQVIESPQTMARLYGAASLGFGAQIKALGPTVQVGLQMFQHSAEVKPNSTHSSVCTEQTFTVTSAAFTVCAFGATPTFGSEKTGVLAARIRVTGVSTGSTHGINNGYVVEQTALLRGTTPGLNTSWERKRITPEGEFLDCMRFFEKTYDPNTIPGTLTSTGDHHFSQPIAAGFVTGFAKVTKRATPTITFNSPNTGVAGKCRDFTGNIDQTASAANQGMNQFTITVVASTGAQIGAHYTWDSRI